MDMLNKIVSSKRKKKKCLLERSELSHENKQKHCKTYLQGQAYFDHDTAPFPSKAHSVHYGQKFEVAEKINIDNLKKDGKKWVWAKPEGANELKKVPLRFLGKPKDLESLTLKDIIEHLVDFEYRVFGDIGSRLEKIEKEQSDIHAVVINTYTSTESEEWSQMKKVKNYNVESEDSSLLTDSEGSMNYYNEDHCGVKNSKNDLGNSLSSDQATSSSSSESDFIPYAGPNAYVDNPNNTVGTQLDRQSKNSSSTNSSVSEIYGGSNLNVSDPNRQLGIQLIEENESMVEQKKNNEKSFKSTGRTNSMLTRNEIVQRSSDKSNENFYSNFIEANCHSKIDFLKENVRNFVDFSKLANGCFGTVYKAKHLLLDKQKDVAVKFNLSKTRHQKEVEMMVMFSHDNLIAISGIIEHKTLGAGIVMELMENSLSGVISSLLNNKLKLSTIMSWFCQICLGMNYLSSMCYHHGDLRASNILVKGNKIKIADFGSSMKHDQFSKEIATKVERAWRWTPPELKRDQKSVRRSKRQSRLESRQRSSRTSVRKNFSSSSDVYSFGCVIYEVLRLGELPFASYSNFEDTKLLENSIKLESVMLWQDKDNNELLPKLKAENVNADLYYHQNDDAETSFVEQTLDDLKAISKRCVSFDPSQRQNFRDLYAFFKSFEPKKLDSTPDNGSISTDGTSLTHDDYFTYHTSIHQHSIQEDKENLSSSYQECDDLFYSGKTIKQENGPYEAYGGGGIRRREEETKQKNNFICKLEETKSLSKVFDFKLNGLPLFVDKSIRKKHEPNLNSCIKETESKQKGSNSCEEKCCCEDDVYVEYGVEYGSEYEIYSSKTTKSSKSKKLRLPSFKFLKAKKDNGNNSRLKEKSLKQRIYEISPKSSADDCVYMTALQSISPQKSTQVVKTPRKQITAPEIVVEAEVHCIEEQETDEHFKEDSSSRLDPIFVLPDAVNQMQICQQQSQRPRMPPKPRPASKPKTSSKARVLYDYQAGDNDEITLAEGEQVEILKEDPNGWFMVRKGGSSDLFPGNYLEKISP